MVEKCANPACAATFRRLGDGRLFVKEVPADPPSDGKGLSRQLHYFWLCSSCCRTMTLSTEKGTGVRVVPLPATAISARAAS
ncbi:MAG TPA: hypothetical protein VEE85_01575 [Candidatus Bathyarchaeia archaeon]|nr:hypothetical protein [Candidatus Bathyarchaeia archaeon]